MADRHVGCSGIWMAARQHLGTQAHGAVWCIFSCLLHFYQSRVCLSHMVITFLRAGLDVLLQFCLPGFRLCFQDEGGAPLLLAHTLYLA